MEWVAPCCVKIKADVAALPVPFPRRLCRTAGSLSPLVVSHRRSPFPVGLCCTAGPLSPSVLLHRRSPFPVGGCVAPPVPFPHRRS